jgi:hypothetical protein
VAVVYPLTQDQQARCNTVETELKADLESTIASTTDQVTIRAALRRFYTNVTPGHWTTYRPSSYIDEINALFDSRVDIRLIHARVAKESRAHLRDCLCLPRFDDSPLLTNAKLEISRLFDDQNTSEDQILEAFERKQNDLRAKRNPEEIDFDTRMAACETETQKVQIYHEWCCKARPHDTAAQTRLRTKWNNLFTQRPPLGYETIYNQVEKDIADSQAAFTKLKSENAELQVLSVAKRREMERKAEKRRAVRRSMFSKHTHHCARTNCMNLAVPESSEKSSLVCATCADLSTDGKLNSNDVAYLCSEECFEYYSVRLPL